MTRPPAPTAVPVEAAPTPTAASAVAGPRRWVRSLRFRLLAATLVALGVALLLAGVLLAGLFRDHVQRQFAASLTTQLDQVTTRLEFDADGRPQLDPTTLSDPRWSRPYSGLYWQVDGAVATDGPATASANPSAAASATAAAEPWRGVLRSRSLWDTALVLPVDALSNGTVHVHEVAGPEAARLLVVERTVHANGPGSAPWRLLVAGDLQANHAAVARFNGVLAASLAVLALLLCAAAAAQVAVGLAPLRALQRALAAVHGGQAQRLQGQFPAEVQPLIDDFNGVLDRNAEVVARARTQAGNLAHAIKTPLAAMAQAAAVAQRQKSVPVPVPVPVPSSPAGAPTPATAEPADLALLVQDQVAVARRHVDWHLARARAAAAQGLPGARVDVAPLLAGLVRVMARVHADRGLVLDSAGVSPHCAFAGEAQDLQEMLGNLLDNACQWARGRVVVTAAVHTNPAGPSAADTRGGANANRPAGEGGAGGARGWRLHVTVDDDGPGIAPAQRAAVLARGARLDESVPGSGLGLAIVHELVGLYGGHMVLGTATLGGLRVELDLPGLA